jgi:hypothetical protein
MEGFPRLHGRLRFPWFLLAKVTGTRQFDVVPPSASAGVSLSMVSVTEVNCDLTILNGKFQK